MSLEFKTIIQNMLIKNNKIVNKFINYDFKKLSQNELKAK